MSKNLIEMQDLTKYFQVSKTAKLHAVDGITLSIPEGETLGVVGESGCGKSTLGRTVLRLHEPTSGKVLFDGRDITALSERKRDELRRYEMSFVFQSVALMSGMNAYENVEFGLRLSKTPYGERDKRVRDVMRSVGLEKRMFHRPSEMSGGEQQRVAIARAIAHEPKVVFADEPTAELDTATGLKVVKLFKQLVAEQGMTIVMTTHDPSMIDIADKVYTIEDGEIVE